MQAVKEEKKSLNCNPKFTLMPNPQNGSMVLLVKDGIPCDCPYRVPVMLPSQTALGQANNAFEVRGFNCSNLCQFFNLSESSEFKDGITYDIHLSCAGKVYLQAEMEEVKAPVNVLKGTRFEVEK